MYVGAVLTGLTALVVILVAPRVGIWQVAGLPARVESHTQQVVRAAFAGAVQSAAWLWMAWKNKSGRSWARVLSAIFFGLFCIGTALGVSRGAIEVRALSVVTWLVALAVTIELWRPESSAFYRREHLPAPSAVRVNQERTEADSA